MTPDPGLLDAEARSLFLPITIDEDEDREDFEPEEYYHD
jgi:hypothetical protein